MATASQASHGRARARVLSFTRLLDSHCPCISPKPAGGANGGSRCAVAARFPVAACWAFAACCAGGAQLCLSHLQARLSAHSVERRLAMIPPPAPAIALLPPTRAALCAVLNPCMPVCALRAEEVTQSEVVVCPAVGPASAASALFSHVQRPPCWPPLCCAVLSLGPPACAQAAHAQREPLQPRPAPAPVRV